MNNSKKTMVNIDDLYFDEQNPRLPQRLQFVKDEKQVIDYMIRKGNIDELMESIAVNGYSDAEPLLVVENNEKKGYIVVEGNRRLSAVKLLSHPEYAKVKISVITDIVNNAKVIPTSVPVIIYESREDILDYLGYRHITGVMEWGSLEKARYLKQLYENHKTEENVYTYLAKMIGSKAAYVLRLHQSLELYELANTNAYYGEDIDEKDISFSWIYTALSYKSIIEFLGLQDEKDADLKTLNSDNYQKLFVWMFGKKRRVTDSRQISDLADIVTESTAIQKLENGCEISEAILYTEGPAKAYVSLLRNVQSTLSQAMNVLPQLKEVPRESEDIIDNIKNTISVIEGKRNTDDSFGNLNFTQEQMKKMYDFLSNRMEK